MIETYGLAETAHYRLEWTRSQTTGRTGYRITARRDMPDRDLMPDATVRLGESGATLILHDPMIPGRGMGLAEYRRLSTRARGIADELEGLARVVEIDIRRLSA